MWWGERKVECQAMRLSSFRGQNLVQLRLPPRVGEVECACVESAHLEYPDLLAVYGECGPELDVCEELVERECAFEQLQDAGLAHEESGEDRAFV